MSMQTMVKVGMEFATSGVDTENPMGIYGICEQLGPRSFRSEAVLEEKV